MSSRRGSHRKGKQSSFHHHQSDENWTVRPIIDRDIQNYEHENSSSVSTPELFPKLSPEDRKSPQNRRNSTWDSRNGDKHQFVNESDEGNKEDKDSDIGSGSRSNLDSNCDSMHEIDDGGCASGTGSRLNLDSDKREINVNVVDYEKGGVKNVEGSNLKEKDFVDDAGKRLEELRVSVEEPQLAEEQLSINSQLQEDEVLANIHEIDGGCASGTGSRLNLDSDKREINVNVVDFEKGGVKNVEGSNLKEKDFVDDAGKRLEELRVSVEEPQLAEEQLSINSQLQEDELLAMESIYGDNISILENQSGLKSFEIHVHVEVPKGLSITAKFNSSNILEKRVNCSPDFSYSFGVEYLPPIILTCLLPKSYPSHLAPFITMSVQWLNSAKISHLCFKLDSIWKEQTGQEVIYQWVEWLRSCTLSYLGFDHEMILGPYGVRHHDIRAISGSVSPDIDVPLMKSYNDEQCHENFCRNIQECCICFSEFSGSEFIRLPCQHYFCQKCLETFSGMHVKEGTVMKLQCPYAKCEGMIPPGLLERLLGEEEFECWESLMLQKTLESMSDVVYCPRCETACLEDEDHHAQCSKCYYSYCTLCRERRHVGVECMTPDMKLLILQERQKTTHMKDEQKRKEKDMISQILSVREISRFAKQCPSCKMAISRTEGCNKMVCNNCGQYFCYRCNQAISGYDHFSDGNCELFPAEEIEKWEERMNGRQVAAQFQAQLFADHAHSCPNCGQDNVKVSNNNHIFCWACQNHYCYLCRKMVRRSSQHYGPKGCKQHTVG